MRTGALLLFGLLAHAAMAAPARLGSYPAFWDALKAGKQVRAVIEYKKTVLTLDGKETPAPDATGGMEFKAWEQFAKGVVRNDRAYVAVSHTVLIDMPRYGGHVFNYVRLRIYEDGQVEITARYLKPNTYEILMDERFMGRISNGRDQNGVHLFAE